MSRRRSIVLAGVVTASITTVLLAATPASAARDRTAPTTPSNLRITATTANSVSLAWNASTDSSAFWYCVQTSGSGCIRVNPPQTTLTRTFNLPNTTFTFAVYALDIAGNRSANSNTVSFTTQADTEAPSPAPVLSVTGLLPTRVDLMWTTAVDAFGSQVFYTLFRDGSPIVLDSGATAATVLNLTPETTYIFQVSVRDAHQNVAVGPALAVTTPAATDNQPPTAPTGVQADSPDGVDLLIRWTASTDNSDAQSSITYHVFVNGMPHGTVLGTPRLWSSCESSDPVAIFVKAVDTSGNESPPSETVIFDECNP